MAIAWTPETGWVESPPEPVEGILVGDKVRFTFWGKTVVGEVSAILQGGYLLRVIRHGRVHHMSSSSILGLAAREDK